MALTQQGAQYKNRDHLVRTERFSGEAMDDLASQVAAVRNQLNAGLTGPPDPPSAPSALQVTTNGSGLFSATIQHNNAPAGTQYVFQYSTSANFTDGATTTEILTHTPGITTTWQKSLPGQKLYFKVAAKFPASEMGSWVYLGSGASPTLREP